MKVRSRLALQLRGPAHAATISGKVEALELKTGAPFDLRPLWSAPPGPAPALLGWASEPWAGCKLDLECEMRPPAEAGGGSAETAHPLLEGRWQVTGTGAAPEIVGELKLHTDAQTRVQTRSNGFPLTVTAGSVVFKPGTLVDPVLDFSLEGYLHALPFHAAVIGPLSRRMVIIDSDEARGLLLGTVPLTLPSPEAESTNPLSTDGVWQPLVFPWKPAEVSPAAAAEHTPAAPAPTAITPEAGK